MKKSAIALMSTFLMLATGASAQNAPGVTDTEIKIGVHLSLSGPASFVGQGAKVGIALAEAEINARGGVNGRKLVFNYVDDRGSPDGGVTAVRKLVDEENSFIVFGAGTSTATVPVLPYFEQRSGVPYYVSLASDPQVMGKFRRNVYSGATSTQIVWGQSMAKFVTDTLKPKRVAMMLCDQAHCISGGPLVRGFLQNGGAEVITTTFNSGDTDFTGQIQQIKSANPDVIFIYGLASDGGRILPQIRRAGITAHIVGDPALGDPSVARMAGAAAENFYTFWSGGTQFIDDKTGPMGQWLQSLDKMKIDRPANTPNTYSTMLYADVYVLAEAIRLTGKNLTREGFMNNLDTKINGFVAGKTPEWNFASAVGFPRTFTPTDHLGNRQLQALVSVGGVFRPAK